MNKINRLYKKALASINASEARKRFLENLKEVESIFSEYSRQYSEGKAESMTPEERYEFDEFVRELEEKYG